MASMVSIISMASLLSLYVLKSRVCVKSVLMLYKHQFFEKIGSPVGVPLSEFASL